MGELSTIIDGLQESTVAVSQWTLRITSYRCGDKFVSIVNNLDPRATICRVCGKTREDAIRQSLEQTNHHLSHTEMRDIAPYSGEPPMLGMILLSGPCSTTYSVEDFLQLPMQDRMSHILSGALTFYDTMGTIMNSGEAMRCLHAASMPAAA